MEDYQDSCQLCAPGTRHGECLAAGPNLYECTRAKGHDGDHAACGGDKPSDHPLCTWPQETPNAPPEPNE